MNTPSPKHNARVHEYQMRFGLPGTCKLLCRRHGGDEAITIPLETGEVELTGVKFGWTEE